MYALIALAAIQTVGGFQQADTIRKNGDIQAEVNNFNAKFADIDAHNALASGYSDAARYDKVIDSVVSSGRAAYASEGVSVGYGTAGDMEKSNKIAGLVNSLQIQRQARDAAMGYETQAINLRMGGQMIQLQSNLQANAAASGGAMQGAQTGINAYMRDQSTGKGNTSRTGTNDQAWKVGSTDMHVTPSGDGFSRPDKVGPDGYGWYNNQTFYGRGPRESYSWDQALGRYSFTGELGG